MASFNKVVLLGNLTRDPDLRYTPNGTTVASFGLAVNRRYRQDEAWHDEVCYVDIVTFGRQAETVGEYLSKGHLAMIEGRLQWRSWETDEGQRRSQHEVVATHVQFMPRGSRGPTHEADQTTRPDGPSRPATSSPGAPLMGGGSGLDEGLPPTDDDIPFVHSDLHEGIRRDRWEPVA
jgi:single-strand DNA-binding protein